MGANRLDGLLGQANRLGGIDQARLKGQARKETPGGFGRGVQLHDPRFDFVQRNVGKCGVDLAKADTAL